MEAYSVLMSVYVKEKPEFLKVSMESMLRQTVQTDDFVLVCDGPLTDGLNTVILQVQQQFPNVLHIIRLEKNTGLGNALREGLKHCRHELVARMDSDDISRPDRCEQQLALFNSEPKLDILSGTIEEFSKSTQVILGRRELPVTYEAICKFSKRRNPFNHPAVMFRKSAVIKAGNYNEAFHLFEDYFLWIRMLANHCNAKNICAPLLYMRAPADLYQRRGGKQYAKELLRFHSWMRKIGWTSWWDYLIGAVPHAALCILPSWIRSWIYRFFRK